jgi:polyisoprenyl-phosphate glycosyltransferase
MKKLSIIIPFYNEEKNIPLVLEAFNLQKNEGENIIDFEVICVNDGSKDNTSYVFKKYEEQKKYPFARFISYKPNGGYGNAILTGVRSSRGDIVCWTHSDMQTDPNDVFKAFSLYTKLNNPKIIIKGRRINRSLSQVLLSLGMSIISSLILRTKLFEINAQPKLFHRSFIKELENAPKDFSLDLFMLYKAKKKGYRIKNIDVAFKDRVHGQSSWNKNFKTRLKTIWRTIKYIWKMERI